MNALTKDLPLFAADEFARMQATLPGHHLSWLQSLRAAALQRFASSGLPTLRDEDWKYTNVAAIAAAHFLLEPAAATTAAGRIEPLALDDAQLLVFVDGRYAPTLSRRVDSPPGIFVGSVAAVLDGAPGLLQERLQAVLDRPRNRQSAGFAAINLAGMADGAYIHLGEGTTLASPIHLLFVASTPALATHTRNVLVAEQDSRASVVEHHVTLDAPSYFTNVVTDIMLGRGARMAHYKVQDESRHAFHIAAIYAELAGEAQLHCAAFAFGGRLSRTDVEVGLEATGAECTLDGLYLSDGTQHTDQHTRIDHYRPQGSSREFYKGVLSGASRAVFNGKVIVHRDAQQSDAAQANRNLLLSEHAEVDTKPQLEIWADDVKCSHAATVGQLDAEQIFYLRTRGMDDAAARALLTWAFANEMVERVSLNALRERLDGLVRGRLPQVLEAMP